MAATTASPSRPSSLFSHRYSDSVISTPRSREPLHSQSFSSSSSTSYVRGPASHSMTYSTPSPPAYNAEELDPSSSPRRASDGDASLDASSSGRVKYACASCIRGHRTSSCTHQDGSKGPLLPIRSKGRPPTQCEICRKKRKESGRHVRCDCTGKKTSPASTAAAGPASHPAKKAAGAKTNVPILPKITDSASADEGFDGERPSKRSRTQDASTSSQTISTSPARTASDQHSRSSAFDNVLAPIRPERGPNSWSLPSIYPPHDAIRAYASSQSDQESTPRRHSTLSLSSLMNPCGCRSTGSCSCCSDQRQRRAPVSPKALNGSSPDCDPASCSCSGDSCRNKKRSAAAREASDATTSIKDATGSSSCCSSKGASTSTAPSIELLLQAVDMSAEFVPPPCGCGVDCRCARCLAKQNATATAQQRSTSQHGSSGMSASSASPRTPPATLPRARTPVSPGTGCDDCAACDLALERPSGIGAVDSWMEKQRGLPVLPRQTSVEGESARSVPSSSRGASPNAAVPTMHGGLLSEEQQEGEEVRAELVLLHPKCKACLEVVRLRGVGVLSAK